MTLTCAEYRIINKRYKYIYNNTNFCIKVIHIHKKCLILQFIIIKSNVKM